MIANLRFTFRMLRRSPWYSATAVGTIALSISLAATVFAVVDGVLFKPLPYPAADRLFTLMGSGAPGEGTAALAPADVRYLREADPRITVSGHGGAAGLTTADRPDVTIWSATVDPYFFEVLRQRPLAGGFVPEHFRTPARDNEPRPALVSYAFWQERLGADPSALGRTVSLVDRRLLIAGILPRDFVFPDSFGRTRPDVLFPQVAGADGENRWNRSLRAVARVAPGLRTEHAKAILDGALASRAGEYAIRVNVHPGPYVGVSMTRLETALGRSERPLFRVAFAGAALLVLLGAINVAGLLAARGRDRELSIRTAIGATRRDVVGVLLSEALIVALAGGVIGIGLALVLLPMAVAMLPPALLLLKPAAIDWRVVAFAIATPVLTLGACALAPALRSARNAIAPRMSAGAASTPRVRTWARRALLAVESAIGLALVVAGSLILASFVVLRAADAGFDPSGLAVVDLRLAGVTTRADAQRRQQDAFEAMQRAAGVNAVATIGVPLLEQMFGGSRFALPAGATRFFANDVPVSGAFFEVARLRVIDGRTLSPEEIDAGRPLAVVSESTARAYWPGRRAVGQTLTGGAASVTVVGVVEEARFGAQDEIRTGEIYVPAGLGRGNWVVYLLRTAGDPDAIVKDVALALQKQIPGVLVRRAESFDRALLESVRLHVFRTWLFGVAAGAGLLLLAVGIGGLVAIGVSRRVREIGIRAALGAQRAQLVRMIVIEHLRPAAAGLALGLLASWWTTRLVSAFLYEIDAHDPIVWSAALATVLAIAAIAAWIPARRAASVDPIVALRAE